MHIEIVLFCLQTLQMAMGMSKIAEQKLNAFRGKVVRSFISRTSPSSGIEFASSQGGGKCPYGLNITS